MVESFVAEVVARPPEPLGFKRFRVYVLGGVS
jgi:hypothetical protein